VRIAARAASVAFYGVVLTGSLVAALVASSASANARDALSLPPWTANSLPPWARSVHVVKGDQPLRSEPNAQSPRRGSAMREARLPLFGARPGPGCNSAWLHVGAQAWTCGDDVTLSGSPPLEAGRAATTRASADGLPFRYHFAGADGSLAYEQIEEADIGVPTMVLEKGFAVAIVRERLLQGERYGLTNRGLWVPMRDFGLSRPFAFAGENIGELNNGEIGVAWVYRREGATVFRKNGRMFIPTGKRKQRFDRVDWLESMDVFGQRYARIDDDHHWVRARDVRHPSISPPPQSPPPGHGELPDGARWIDVQLDSQTLVAFVGDKPVYATMVSTGKSKRKGHPFETPKGVFRIWVKLLTTTMDNLENENANRYYRIEDVPYVQFFSKGVGLHAAFWHRSFGNVRSHGCVNLAPIDAQRLFTFTEPRVAAGWSAALPSKHDQGTIIRVR
jgi:hypothetical protein